MTQDAGTEWDSSNINRLIAAGNHADAAKAVDDALERNPGFLPACMARVRLHIATGDHRSASELSVALLDGAPDNAWVWLLALQAHARAGALDTATALFHDNFARLSPDAAVLSAALNDLLPALGGAATQVAFLSKALEHQPDNRDLQLKLATRAHLAGEFDLALDLLGKAEKKGPLPPFAKRVHSQLYPHLGTMAGATDRIAADVDAGAQDVETLCRLCRYAAASGRFAQSRQALDRALELHPLEWRTLYRLNRVFLPGARDLEVFRTLDQFRTKGEADRNWLLQFAFFALRVGETRVARGILTELARDGVIGPTARDLLNALETLGDPRPRAEVIEDGDVRVVRKSDARGAIFVFGNFLGGLSYMPDRYLDALLADLPANVVYLRDPFGRAYLNGIPALGPDEAAMQKALRAMAADLGGGEIVTLGGSASGYAALRNGLAIDANHVVSFAGPITPGQAAEKDPFHSRLGAVELFGKDLPSMDLRPLLAHRPGTHLTLVIGADYEPDVMRSRAAQDLANATIRMLPGTETHHCAIPAITDGTLYEVLQKALGAGEP